MQKHWARIKTGLFLGLLSIVSIFFFPNWLFFILCGGVISAAFWEFLNLIGYHTLAKKGLGMVIFWALTALMLQHRQGTFYLAVIGWILAAVLIFVPLPRLAFFKKGWLQLCVGVLMLAPAWVAFVEVHQHWRTLVFYLIMLICFADTGAYFVGTAMGRHKLLPKVSPKKSVEGLIGGLIIGDLAGLSVVLFLPHWGGISLRLWGIAGVILILVSVLGDLFESLLKRLYDAKDSGSLLPGHGGLLDRMDSLCAAAPFFVLFCYATHLI